MNRERFEQLVITAVESLPEELHDRLENITVVVEEEIEKAKCSRRKQTG